MTTMLSQRTSVVAVKLEENEVELLNPDPLSISNKTLTIKSESVERDLAIPDLEDDLLNRFLKHPEWQDCRG